MWQIIIFYIFTGIYYRCQVWRGAGSKKAGSTAGQSVSDRSKSITFYLIGSDKVFLIACLIRSLISIGSDGGISAPSPDRSANRRAVLIISNCFLNLLQYLHIQRCTDIIIRSENGRVWSMDLETFFETSLQLNIQCDIVRSLALYSKPFFFDTLSQPHPRPVKHNPAIRRRNFQGLTNFFCA